MAASQPTIWTIGHSTRTLEEFVALLRGQRIGLVADVRSYPGSRRYPHFNREALAVSLPAAGVEYRPFPLLGGRRRVRADSPNTAWRNASFRGYADYMQTEPFGEGLGRLLEAAGERRTAIMCSEAVWWRCHRSMISDALKARGVLVLHIMDRGQVQQHPYTAPARIVDGRLTYTRQDPVGGSDLFEPHHSKKG